MTLEQSCGSARLRHLITPERKDCPVRRLFLITVLVALAAAFLAACGSDGGHGDASPVADGAIEIAVTADNFAFDPDDLTVATGDDIAIVLTSVDIPHDFTIDELDAHVAADRGETTTGGFRASRPGRYTFYCAEPGHRQAGMEGTLIVEG
jgi:cytochrome c oxidase subunit 2